MHAGKLTRGSGSFCAVRGCANSWKRLNIWLQGECYDHRPATRRVCGCAPPYALYLKPKGKYKSMMWLAALKLKGPPKRVYVCSYHFVDKKPTENNPFPELWLGYERPPQRKKRQRSIGFHSGSNSCRKPAYEMAGIHPDWVPSLNLGHSEIKPTRTGRFERKERRSFRVAVETPVPPLNKEDQLTAVTMEEADQTIQKCDSPSHDHDYCVRQSSTLATAELQTELKRMEARLLYSHFCLQRFAGSDEDIHFFTRFASYRHLQNFWRLINSTETRLIQETYSPTSAANLSTKLPHIDELFMFLMYLSVGLHPEDLSKRFGVSQVAVNGVLTVWTHLLYQLLGSTPLWMAQDDVRALLPPVFEAFPDTQVLLHCTEIYCEAPSNFSKSHSTLKAVVGMAPHGAVTFVSSLFPGSMSEGEIFKQSGITSLLQQEMAIMVHKGFLIDDVTSCKVHRPAFSEKYIMSIARLNTHLESCAQRVKENKLFSQILPASVCGGINKLFHVACYLVNYQDAPLMKVPA